MQDQPILDHAPIADLLDIGGPDLVQELTELFFADTPELIAAIESAVATEDWEALTRASHSLKSSAFYLGALALSELSRQLEQSSRAGETGSCVELSRSTPAAYEAAKLALLEMRAELPPA
jgi:HPt (histidine-containing phosphotransfer) domain-containing protein